MATKTSFFMKLLLALCLVVGLTGGLRAQTLTVTINGTLGPYISGSGEITSAKYVSGLTATGAKGTTCEVSFNGGTTAATGTITLSAKNTPGVGVITLLIFGSGYAYPGPTTASVISGGSATCSGTATVTSVVDDSLGLNGQSFTGTNNINPVGVPYNATTNTYTNLPLEFKAGIFTLTCNATVKVTAGSTGNDTLNVSDCTFLAGDTAFTSTVAFAGETVPAPVPMAFNSANLIASASNGTYIPGNGTTFQGDVTELGIGGSISATCTGCPTETLSPSGPLSFNAVAGGPAPAAQAVTVATGSSTESYAATTSASWITVNNLSTTGGNTGTSFNVGVNPAGLTAGNYSGTVCVYSAASNSTANACNNSSDPTPSVTVNLTVAAPVLVPAPTSLTFTSTNGAVPATQSLSVSTSNASAVAFTATPSSTGNWLSVTPTSGTTGQTTMTVSADPTKAAAGTNTGTITLSAAGFASVPVTVTFNVTAALPSMQVPPGTSFTFAYNPSALPPSQTVVVGSSTSTAISYTASTTSSGGSWLQVAPTSASTGATETVSIITGVASTLAPGSYSGTVVFTCTAGTCANAGGKLSVPVTLNVTATLTPAPTSVTFNYTIGSGTTPSPIPIGVTSNGQPLTYTPSASTTSGGNWLAVAPTSPVTTPNGVTASVNASALTGLAAGTYAGSIKLTATGANNSPVTIPATLVVSSALQSSSPSLTFAYQTGGAAPPSQPLTITSNGAPLTITATASGTNNGVTWLSVSQPTGPTPQTLTVSVAPGSLTSGSYNGSIAIASAQAGNSPLIIPVTLNVSTLPSLTATPSSLSASYTIGGTVPVLPTVTIGSSGSALSNVSTGAPTVPWLSVSQSGTTTPGVTLTVSLVSASLPTTAGSYTGSFAINATGAAAPLTYTVTLNVAAQPTLSVSPLSLSFTGQVNGASPAAQTLAVNSTNGSVSFTAKAATTTGGNWLSVSPLSGSTNASLQVSANTTGLATGTYSGSITVTASGAAGSPAVIPVTLSVTSTPNLIVNPTVLSFAASTGAAAPAGQSVAVSTSNGSVAAFTVSAATTSGGNWLQPTPASGNTPSSFVANVVSGSLAAGTYNGTITVSATGFTSATVAVTVVVTQAKAVILISGGSLFALPNTAAPATSTLTISASDGSAQPFSIATGATQYNWLTLSPTSGTTPGTVKLTANPAGLIPGIYVTPITVTIPGLPIPTKTIQAQLTVTGSNLAASPNMLTFTYQPGLPLPPAQTISLTTVSGGTVALTSVTANVGWIIVSPATSAPATLQVSINPGLLSPGTYTGDVLVKGVGSPDASLEIPVTITVTAAQPITATPASLAFNYQTGGAAPAAQNVAIASGNVTVNYTVASQGSWLQVSPAKGTTPGSLAVTAVPTGLAPGTYGGTITVTVTGAANSVSIPVTLTITGQSQLTFSASQIFFATATGAAAPAPQSLTISSTGGPVAFTAAGGSIWLTVTPSNGTAPATLAVTVNAANLAVGTYNGTINITPAGAVVPQMVLVTLVVGSGGPTPTIAGVINAASGVVGTIAPGMAISIFGASLGPQTGTPWIVPQQGETVATSLGGTEVLFDGLPVPLLYTSSTQVNAMVPFGLSGKATTRLEVVNNGVTSAPMTVAVVPAEPGLFTADATGKGQGAILNQDYSVNGSSTPAAAGSTIMIFGTGGGVTDPASTDGSFNPMTSTGTLVATPVTATIAGQPAQVTYSGPAPGLVAGIFQINVTIPADTLSGSQLLAVSVGNLASQTVTVAVQ